MKGYLLLNLSSSISLSLSIQTNSPPWCNKDALHLSVASLPPSWKNIHNNLLRIPACTSPLYLPSHWLSHFKDLPALLYGHHPITHDGCPTHHSPMTHLCLPIQACSFALFGRQPGGVFSVPQPDATVTTIAIQLLTVCCHWW